MGGRSPTEPSGSGGRCPQPTHPHHAQWPCKGASRLWFLLQCEVPFPPTLEGGVSALWAVQVHFEFACCTLERKTA